MNCLPEISFLKDRAMMLHSVRSFFYLRKVLEVDCPLFSASAAIDEHIELVQALCCEKAGYLHSSPEYGMKRLLAQGLGDIYQLSHVFRDGEVGAKHQPEFMLLEWYRQGFSLQDLIAEAVELIQLFLGEVSYSIISYHQALLDYAGIDYLSASDEELWRSLDNPYPGLLEEGRDALLNMLLAEKVEPYLGQQELTVLAYYPCSQAALAQIIDCDGEQVAERFEIYYQGLELANGYHELASPVEQRERLEKANSARKLQGKKTLPVDENFLAALTIGLPDCCGVAVGFDRLMMARHQVKDIRDVLPISWEQA
ncbi:MAG: EF-P lysine aminoacylase EpmA [Chlamydiota bacterium]